MRESLKDGNSFYRSLYIFLLEQFTLCGSGNVVLNKLASFASVLNNKFANLEIENCKNYE